MKENLKIVKCDNCGKDCLKWNCLIKRSKNHFCNYNCKKLWQKGKHHGGYTEICPVCKKIYYIKPSALKRNGNPRKTCSMKCRSKLLSSRIFELNPKWKGGWKTKNGYIFQGGTKTGKLAHRRLWEKENGEIEEGLVIHHINEDKIDNNIDNLDIMTRSQHSKLHKLGIR